MVKMLDTRYLGKGIYTPQQAARYARLHTQTLNRWIYGNATGDSALRAEMPDEKGRFVTFVDFAQALAVRAIRLSRNVDQQVSLQKLRLLVERAKEMGIDYPFARRHTTWLFDDDIVLRIEDDETLIQITGKYHHNQLIQPVIELYGEDLGYNPTTGLADRYTPFTYRDFSITLDPAIRFGEPMVEGTSYSVNALANAVLSEGSVDAAADIFGVPQDAIRAAQRFDDWLKGIAA